jgi:hypothetical protein
MNRNVIGMLALAASGLLFGCGPGGPKTFPVTGQVELVGGEIKLLVGSHVEAALESDATIRASGQIQEDGSFRLQSLHQGATKAGAREGKYKVRLILADDDQANLKQARKAVPPRYLNFATSGLSVTVPPTGEVALTIAPR